MEPIDIGELEEKMFELSAAVKKAKKEKNQLISEMFKQPTVREVTQRHLDEAIKELNIEFYESYQKKMIKERKKKNSSGDGESSASNTTDDYENSRLEKLTAFEAKVEEILEIGLKQERELPVEKNTIVIEENIASESEPQEDSETLTDVPTD